MPDYVAPKRLYHTADRSRIVEDGDPDAAFLLVAEGVVLPEAEAKRLGLLEHVSEYKAPDPLKAEEAALKAAEDEGRIYEAQSRRNAVERLKADPPAEGVVMAEYGGLAGAPAREAAAPTPAEAQPDSGNANEVVRAGAKPRAAKPDKGKGE